MVLSPQQSSICEIAKCLPFRARSIDQETIMLVRRYLLPGIVVLCTVLLSAPPVSAGTLNQGLDEIALTELFPGAEFAADIPSQVEATGVEPCQRPLRPEEALAYFQALADASPRARLIEFARSHEDRPLVVLAISDEQTIADLDAFKQRHADQMDPRTGVKAAATDKAVAWMAYGIHGDELSSTDAAVSLAYWLVAGQDDRAARLRDNLVVLIDPCENPDGRSRYLAQTLSFAHKTANPDQDDLSHAAVWPWGRGNHYLFDMNRDWFSMIHPESARSKIIASWLPQMLVDSHEMGANATYLFPPPRHPFNPFLPDNARKWEKPFSDDQAGALDERGYPYFSGEWNEEFFPGYGSSWASYLGSIGILYEMSRTSGTLVRKREGTVRTFAQAVEHQVTSSVANLESLSANSAEVLADHAAARARAIESGRAGELRAWVYPADSRHPERLEDFARVLTDQGIEVQVLRGDAVTGKQLRDARTGRKEDRKLTSGSLLVRMDQPAAALARVILDPHVPMETVFFQEEREYLEKGKGSRLYETTSWSLPLGRGIPAWWSSRVPGGDWRAWTPTVATAPSTIVGEFTSLIIDGDSDAAPRALADLLQAGAVVRIANKEFTIGGQAFRPGALVLRKEGNIDDLAALVSPIAARHGVAVHAVHTSRSEQGPYLGGSEFPMLVAPRVGVLSASPISSTEYGAVWHLLDQELDLRFSSLDIGRFGRIDLSRYNVLVFPPARGGAAMYRQLIGENGMKRLRAWIEAGGTAIGFGGGARLLADKETELTKTRFRNQAVESYPSPVWSISAAAAEAAGRPTAVGMRIESQPKGKDDEVKKKLELKRESAFDVAPILGPGAAPFAKAHKQGTPLEDEPVTMNDWLKETLPAGSKGAEEKDLARADARLRRFMPQGAMLNADLDPELWLNYGLDERITVWFGGDDSLVAAAPVRVAARFPAIDELHIGGLLWPEAAARLTGTAYMTREGVGRGQVILFAENPVFRRWMKDSERMMINAILMGPGLGTRWSAAW
jgi:Zinc carboxypeptidase